MGVWGSNGQHLWPGCHYINNLAGSSLSLGLLSAFSERSRFGTWMWKSLRTWNRGKLSSGAIMLPTWLTRQEAAQLLPIKLSQVGAFLNSVRLISIWGLSGAR